jgi:small GTP-binding protein
MSIISKKICIIGESEVGKNSLIRYSVEDQFSDNYLSTVGVTIAQKTIEFQGIQPSSKLKLNLLIWDITGQPQFQAMSPTYLQGSCGAVAVADVSRPETIKRLPIYIQNFLAINPQSFVIIALNKFDLIQVDNLEPLVQHLDLSQVSAIYPTSAKTGLHIDNIFSHIAYKILKSYSGNLPPLQSFPFLLGSPNSSLANKFKRE